ncbi:flagellar basal-body MS-ring/collar protein FliF [Candidatus Margulisiibacteriota bacterium]
MAEAPAAEGMDVRRMLLLGGVAVVLLFAMLFFLFRSCLPSARGGGNYVVIYSNLELKDAANAIVRLKELNIPYDIREEGRIIAVPKDVSDDARLGLAEKNLPAGGVVGWEIFDETKLGATDFDRRIQLIRAISGELSRTIRRIEAIDDVRVQIVLPETKLFAATVAPVTASVMLRIRPGYELSQDKINGIVHLVASSVENLQTENVTVVDDAGYILTAQKMLAAPELLASPAEAAILSAEAVPGLLPEVEAVSPEVITESATAPALSEEERILFKVQANKELELNLSGKAQEILNRFYPPNSAITRVNVDLDTHRKTAVILIDNRVEMSADIKQATYKSVAAAIGYDRSRGDRLVLQRVPFHLATPPPEQVKAEVEKVLPPKVEVEPKPKPIFNFAWLSIIFFIVVLSVLLLSAVWILIKKLRPGQPPESASLAASEKPLNNERASALNNVKSAADKNPERIAELLKKWLAE